MQWDGGINDQAISQHNQADIAPGQGFADKVWAPLILDVPAARYLARKDARVFRKRHRAIARRLECNVHKIPPLDFHA